jgi:hypothetical protein
MAVPPSVPADGNLRISWITTYVPGTLLAATATAGVDLSCYFTADGFTRALNEAAITDERLCTTQSGERPGRYSETLETMYVYDPQDATPSNNLAFDTLVPGATGFIVARYGFAYTAAYAATQKVDVIQVTCGRQQKQAAAANDVLKIGQKLFIPSGGIVYGQALT